MMFITDWFSTILDLAGVIQKVRVILVPWCNPNIQVIKVNINYINIL